MSVPVSPKRTALLAAARERILVLDGAMGPMIATSGATTIF
jgi:5-methyltetrahydrofolate--homocysteine methyltransferase